MTIHDWKGFPVALQDLEELLIRWRRARAHFGYLGTQDPDMLDEETRAADKEVIESTGALFDWIEKYLPHWRKK